MIVIGSNKEHALMCDEFKRTLSIL